jgi:hypothetical protein
MMSSEDVCEILFDNRHLTVSNLPQQKNVVGFPRHYIQHRYHDHSRDAPLEKEIKLNSGDCIYVQDSSLEKNFTANLPNKEQFPLKLHRLLDIVRNNGYDSIISWQIHGRAFKIHKADEFSNAIMPFYFRQTKLASFRRQLNIYGFLRITQGLDKGAYYHECFLRGKYFLAERILRQKLKGTMVKGVPCPESEPNFYSMPYVEVVASESPPKLVASISEQKSSSSVRISSPLTLPSSSIPLHSPSVSDIKSINCNGCNPTMDLDSTKAVSKLTTHPMQEEILDYISHDDEDLGGGLTGGYTSDDFSLDFHFCEEAIACLIRELREPLDSP